MPPTPRSPCSLQRGPARPRRKPWPSARPPQAGTLLHTQAGFKLHGKPVVPIRSPRLRGVERELFSAEDVARIVAAQPELHDRVALKLLFLMGLRKGELAAIRDRDFDLGRQLRVHGSGVARAGVVDEVTTHGERMHGARYTSGTEFYLATGDIYATQQLLGYADEYDREHLRPGHAATTSRTNSGRSGANELRTTIPIERLTRIVPIGKIALSG